MFLQGDEVGEMVRNSLLHMHCPMQLHTALHVANLLILYDSPHFVAHVIGGGGTMAITTRINS